MPACSTLTVLSGSANTTLSFVSVFGHFVDSLEYLGAYSEIIAHGIKHINRSANLTFCKHVPGTVYGHFPVQVPHATREDDYIIRSPFFHFSTLKDENIENADTVMSIKLDADKQSGILLILMAEYLISKGYRTYFKLYDTSSESPIELTKESINRYK